MFTNKPAIVYLIFIMIAVLLSGCGGANTANSSTAREQADQTAAETEAAHAGTEKPAADKPAAAARTVTDAMGREVAVPEHPSRIIAHYFASEAAALGLPLVGTNFINAAEVLTPEQLRGVEDIGGEGGAVNLEKALALKPDIILVPNFLEAADLDALSKIAPVFAIDYGSDVFAKLRAIGGITGASERSEAWIAAYEAKAKAKRDELKSVIQPGETAAAYIMYQDKQLYLYGPKWLGQTMNRALGFAIPPKVTALFDRKPDSLWETISLEVLPEYAADNMFLLVPGDNADAKKAAEELVDGPIWKSLPAVKNGKAHVVDGKWGFTDPMTLDWLLDEMTNVLEEKE
ncbi:ABC transporter substrate-binding protein [Paenibacillus sp. MWE-103]|uniref:ABC transporter substrate-binding protein n=1 Tax=Paenibacillus artemisiicola TaxID=1172618 RepID=A0ABS3W3W5_9BACL|nr:ABC transporter substrate-binding protein [Paenibacillus artemisiicola]MBO7742983.1 ABC transporter substrate-binding protein [Paenibacillus artemisiicola]